MDPLIKKIALQCGFTFTTRRDGQVQLSYKQSGDVTLQAFAHAIIDEAAQICAGATALHIARQIENHFGYSCGPEDEAAYLEITARRARREELKKERTGES